MGGGTEEQFVNLVHTAWSFGDLQTTCQKIALEVSNHLVRLDNVAA